MEITNREIRKGCMRPFKGKLFSAFCVSAICPTFFGAYLLSDFLIKRLPLNEYVKITLSALGLISAGAVFYFTLSWYYGAVSGTRMPKAKLLGLFILISLKAVFEAVLFFAPAVTLSAFIDLLPIGGSIYAFIPAAVKTAFYVLSLLFLFSFQTKYFPAPFILMEYKDLKLGEVLKKSARCVKDRRFYSLCFIAESMLYLIPCAAVIPSFYFLPKLFSSLSLYGKYLCEKTRMK